MSPAAEQVADGQHRAAPTPFLTKTYQLVDDPSNNNVISWSCGGTAFVVLRPDDFARDLLPHRFKHNNFSSFVRQLNTYGFKKISSDRWEFAHDLFRRGGQHLLCRIDRRKVTPAAPPADRPASPASSGENPAAARCGMAELMEENEELRRENKRLASENAEMKILCNTIRLLVSPGSPQSGGGGNGAEASPLLEPVAGGGAEDGGGRPRVFGVQIGSKRTREEEELQLMPPGVISPSKGSIPGPQEDGELVRLSLCQVSNRRVCNASNRYFHPAISIG